MVYKSFESNSSYLHLFIQSCIFILLNGPESRYNAKKAIKDMKLYIEPSSSYLKIILNFTPVIASVAPISISISISIIVEN